MRWVPYIVSASASSVRLRNENSIRCIALFRVQTLANIIPHCTYKKNLRHNTNSINESTLIDIRMFAKS